MMHVFLSPDSPSQKTIGNIFYSFRHLVAFYLLALQIVINIPQVADIKTIRSTYKNGILEIVFKKKRETEA